MNPGQKKFIQYFLIVAVGGFFLYFVFKGTDWASMWSKISSADLYWLSHGMVVSILSHWIRGYRGTLMYDALGYKIGATNSFYAVMVGYMMNYVIPRAGEVSRCASLAKSNGLPIEKSLGTVVTERLVDMLMLLLILGLILIFQFDLIYNFIVENNKNNAAQSSNPGSSSLKWILLAAGVIVALTLLVFRKKIMSHPLVQKLKTGFIDGLLSIKHMKKPGLFVFLSFAIWACYVLMMYFCLFALPQTAHLGFLECLTVFAIGTIGMVLPAPGAGAGSYHFFVMSGLMLFGISREDGVAYATLVHGFQMILLILAGLVCSALVLHNQKVHPVS